MDYDSHVMVVEPDPGVRDTLNTWLGKEGYHVTALDNGESALKLIHERLWDLMIFSMTPPGMGDLKVIEYIVKAQSGIPILVILEPEQFNMASQAVKLGAAEYITKPLDHAAVLVLVRRILECRICNKESGLLRRRLDALFGLYPIVGRSPAMMEIKENTRQVGSSNKPVIIYGEPGIGKEHLAKTIHANSLRRYMPFETVSLGSIQEALIESELFGHEKAAFTGAAFIKKGGFELANYGTVYLDEVAELSPALQEKVEEVLEKKEFRRVDGTQEIKTDVHVICSSQSNLAQSVDNGNFRESLYNLLNASSFYIPPLRERPEDIPLLADHFLQIFSARINKKIKRISQKALDFLTDYSWPGNVHELHNAIERAVILARSDQVDPDDLPFSIRGYLETPRTKSIKEWEKYHIQRVLDENGWNISKSAKDLEIDRVTLYNKIKKYKLKRPGEERKTEEPQ